MESVNATILFNRADIEDFLYQEAYLLDEWRLDDWGQLLTEDAKYYVPPNDVPKGNPKDTLFHIADDIERIHSRIKRLKSRHAHAENPHSRTRRLLTNVRITERTEQFIHVSANFIVMRFRRNEQVRQYVGMYEYKLAIRDGKLKIAERKAILDSEELGSLGSISILL
jgi:p-cumate 2,3-dioxygenase beta subunit